MSTSTNRKTKQNAKKETKKVAIDREQRKGEERSDPSRRSEKDTEAKNSKTQLETQLPEGVLRFTPVYKRNLIRFDFLRFGRYLNR